MSNYRRLLVCLLFVLLPGLTLLFSLTSVAHMQTTSGFVYPAEPPQAVPQPATPSVAPFTGTHSTVSPAAASPLTNRLLSETPFTLPSSSRSAPATLQDDQVCYQLLVNPQLDVLDVAGEKRADPWVPVYDIVYVSTNAWVSPDHSLFLWDTDPDDQSISPNVDGLGQAFFMPTDLVSVTVDYQTATVEKNSVDKVFGEFWSLDDQGFLDEFLLYWEVGETDGDWVPEFVSITDPALLTPLQDKLLALILVSETDNQSPGEAVWFDDVTITACVVVEPSIFSVYLPITVNNPYEGPVCVPPTELSSINRVAQPGRVQTGAVCQDTLSGSSNISDLRDDYIFSPLESGNHTFHLRKLPSGTEWSLALYVGTENPSLAPGPNGGKCYISTPGSNDKSIICPVQAGQQYLILVDAGAYKGPPQSYEMQVTKP